VTGVQTCALPISGAPLRYNNLGVLGVAQCARLPEEIGAALDAAVAAGLPGHEAMAAFSDRYNIGDDGQAAERCARTIAAGEVLGSDRCSAEQLMLKSS